MSKPLKLMPFEQNRLPWIAPCVKGKMGDWIFYCASTTMKNIASNVAFAEEIHKSITLKELLQRRLTKRGPDIADYLIKQDQRFFNSLVVGVYHGDPKFHELRVDIPKHILELWPGAMEGMLGVLEFSGNEKMFAIDGQHRVAGIRLAVAKDRLANEEMGVIFIGHKNSESGRVRTRRLFSTLNRHAKAVNKKDIVALDEDDIIAVITRRLLEEHKLFDGTLSLQGGKNINNKDRFSLTSIVTLYDAVDFYSKVLYSKKVGLSWNKFKRFHPGDAIESELFGLTVKLFNVLLENFSALSKYLSLRKNLKTKDEAALTFRNSHGGSLLFRPIGFQLIIRTLARLQDGNFMTLKAAAAAVASAPQMLDEKPWVGLLWNPESRRMITTGPHQIIAERILFHALGGKLAAQWKDSTASKLLIEYAGAINKSPHRVRLPKFNSSP